MDQYTSGKLDDLVSATNFEAETERVGIRQTSFTWTNEETDGDVTPGRRSFRLRIDDEVFFKQGCINLVIGQTGTGKTSLLMALLGETYSRNLYIRTEFRYQERCIQFLWVLTLLSASLDKVVWLTMHKSRGY